MHKLMNDRVQWEVWALLAGMPISLGILFRHGVAPAFDLLNVFSLILWASGWLFVAGIALILLLNRAPEAPGRKAAIYLSGGMASLPLAGPLLMLVSIVIFQQLGLLVLPCLLFWLLTLLAKMRNWRPFVVALLGSVWALLMMYGWLAVMTDL
jgi:hypothetical protein